MTLSERNYYPHHKAIIMQRSPQSYHAAALHLQRWSAWHM